MELREYQTRAVDLVRDKIRQGHKRVVLVMPTGSGKTHTMAWIAKRSIENGHKVLALMHRRQLVDQMVERFAECGIETGRIMSGTEHDLGCDCQVATMQTYGRRMDLCSLDDNRFWIDASVVLVDECHHILSKSYQKIMAQYAGKIVVGVTATPTLSNGIGLGEYFDAIVQPVGIDELIKTGHLVPAVYYGPAAPDLSGLKTVMGDFEKKGLNEVMSKPKIIGDVVDNWLRIAGDKRTMVFAVKVSHSKALVREFLARGIRAEHLDAHSDDLSRSETIGRFSDGITQVLCNVGLYSEGTDLPFIECISLARPTKSIGLYLQMVGRGARPYPGKDGFILIDHGGCVQRLGFYEDDIEWSLDGKKMPHRKKVVRKKEKTPMTCDKCQAVFTGNRCPQCGTEVKDWGKKIEAAEAELERLDTGKKGTKKKPTMADKQLFWSMLMYQKRSGKSHKWCLAKYKSNYGVWPRNLKDTPVEPDEAFVRRCKYLDVKYWKSKQAQRGNRELDNNYAATVSA